MIDRKVICIADEWDPPSALPDAPIPDFAPNRGDVLTVQSVDDGGFYFFAELPRNYVLPGGIVATVSWPPEAFRPVATPEQDIALFAPLLGQPVLEDA